MKKILGFTALIVMTLSLRAGYYLEQREVSYKNGAKKEGVTKIWIQGKNLKMESPSAITIINYGTQMAYFANKRRKTYYKMTVSQLKQMINAMVTMMKQMGTNLTPKIVITSQKKKIGEYNCTVVNLEMGSFQKIEQCLSPQVKLPSEVLYNILGVLLPEDLYREMKARRKSLSKLGFPVYSRSTINMMGREAVTETYLIKYQETPIPPSEFTIPSGYQEKEFRSPFGAR